MITLIKFSVASVMLLMLCAACAPDDQLSTANSVADNSPCLVEDAQFQNGGGGCLQRSNGIVWGIAYPNRVSLGAASEFCRRLTVYVRIGAEQVPFTGWDIPSFDELRGLAGLENGRRHIRIRGNDFFWTSSGLDSDTPEIPSRQTVIDVLTGEDDSYVRDTQRAVFICRRFADRAP